MAAGRLTGAARLCQGWCLLWCFCLGSKGGAVGSWSRPEENSWHSCNRAGSRKWCHEVTNRKRPWKHNAPALGPSARKALLQRGCQRRERFGPAHSHAAVLLSQIVFTLSCYLNNKMGTVNDNLHFRSCFSRGIWKIWMNPHNILSRRVGVVNSFVCVGSRGVLKGGSWRTRDECPAENAAIKMRPAQPSLSQPSIGCQLVVLILPELPCYFSCLSMGQSWRNLPFFVNPIETLCTWIDLEVWLAWSRSFVFGWL